jgi:protein SCO1/2
MNKTLIFLILFTIAGVSFTYFMMKPEKHKDLPVINPVDLNEEMVDSLLVRKGYGHKIGSFSFTDQEGNTFTDKDVRGKVFIAEYFFTTCKTICPIMNSQMQRVHKAYKSNSAVQILSFTVDPDTDSVAQMKKYATRHQADSKQWHFLTGDKNKLYSLARKSFFVLKPAEAVNQGDVGSDFIHTNNFVLVDRQMRIRGYYDGTSAKEVDELIGDIQILLDEK